MRGGALCEITGFIGTPKAHTVIIVVNGASMHRKVPIEKFLPHIYEAYMPFGIAVVNANEAATPTTVEVPGQMGEWGEEDATVSPCTEVMSP
jgi:hypothetical protein